MNNSIGSYNFSPTIKISHQEATLNTLYHPKIKWLQSENLSSSEKTLAALGLGVKIFFAPLTLLAYLITKSFYQFAANEGLGREAEVRHVDQIKRSQLIDLGGKEILFGFNKKPVLEGMFFHSNSSNPNAKTILVCTGSHRSYEKYAVPMVKALKSMGHHVMVFNYEGFGKSEGVRSEECNGPHFLDHQLS